MPLLGPAYFKFSPPNMKFKKTLQQQGLYIINFSLPAGRACPGADKCWAMATVDPDGNVTLKKGVDNEYICYAAKGEVVYANVRRARAHNKALIDGLSTHEIVDLMLLSLEFNYKSLIKKPTYLDGMSREISIYLNTGMRFLFLLKSYPTSFITPIRKIFLYSKMSKT